MAAQLEWVLMLLFLGLLVVELVLTRRAIRRAGDRPRVDTRDDAPKQR